ncbi:MAG: CBS domain-containing protein [Acidobacteria bacterium]|nr:CBS domain-containing protein [Acidobacteriota bacterium]
MSFEATLRSEKIRHLAVAAVARVERDASLREAVGILRNNRLGCVLVCEGEQLVGILTERDLVKKVFVSKVDWNAIVEKFMTPKPMTLSLDDSLADTMQMMDAGGFRNVPVLDDRGRLAGVVSVRHIIDYLAEHFPAEVLNLPPRLHQTMEAPDGA